jgi:SnoaL-like domain
MDFLDELREIEAIKQLKYRYMRAIDEKLWDQMRDCFVEEATCSYSGGKYAFEGREAILRFLTESMDRPTFLSAHRVHHPEIQLTSETTARGIWALDDYVIDEQYGLTIHGAAFYRDEYVKRDGAWKLLHTGYTRTFEQMQSRKDRGWNLTQRGFGDAPTRG